MKLITAPIVDPLCVFMVGVQIKSARSFWKIPYIAGKMRQMQKELREDPESGFIWGTNFTKFAPFTTLFLSYWTSADYIDQFIKRDKFSHKRESVAYWKRFGKDTDVGVWHETYEIDPQRTENLYFGMEPFGVSAFLPIAKVDAANRAYVQRLRRAA